MTKDDSPQCGNVRSVGLSWAWKVYLNILEGALHNRVHCIFEGWSQMIDPRWGIPFLRVKHNILRIIKLIGEFALQIDGCQILFCTIIMQKARSYHCTQWQVASSLSAVLHEHSSLRSLLLVFIGVISSVPSGANETSKWSWHWSRCQR